MSRIVFSLLIVFAAAGGFFARGWFIDPDALADAHHEDEHHDDEHDDEPPHVPLTQEAYDMLGLRLGQVAISDFRRTVRTPADVVEFPGVSAYKLAAPVNGVVTAVAAQPGASVVSDDALFVVRVTDEQVLDAQLELLESLTRREIVDDELQRLAPLTASGAVRGRQRIDLEYERRQLATTIALRQEELIVRGLSEAQVQQLINSKRLLRNVVVRAPKLPLSLDQPDFAAEVARTVRPVAWEEPVAGEDEGTEIDMSVERLLVQPGQTVKRGESLCDIASHSQLYLEGHAFESELPVLVSLARQGGTLSAEFGHSMADHEATSNLVTDLAVRYVANHVDPVSKTYTFFMPLRNDVLYETTDDSGFRYRTWRYSVGQRAHVLLPTTKILGQIPLPVAAVAIEGPNAFVFTPLEDHDHDDEDHDDPDHDDGRDHDDDSDEAHHEEDDHHDDDDHHDEYEDIVVELGPVPVTVLYRDQHHVVVASGGELHAGDTIAMNAAYQLQLALKAEEGGGGHHHHHH